MDGEGSRAFMSNILNQFVQPEVGRRRADGSLPSEELWATQVIFDVTAPSPRIRINEEVRLLALRPDSTVFEDYVTAYKSGHRQFTAIALPEDERGIRHITLCLVNVTSTWKSFFSLGAPSIQAPVEGHATFQAGYQPPSLTEWKQLYAEHDRVVEKVLAFSSAVPEAPIEILMAIAIQRSRHLLEAYIELVKVKNLTAASALIRMQLDSAMRINACFLVTNPMQLWEVLKAGEAWNRVKSADGRPLSDAYLHTHLSQRFEWATSIYQQMSGYVHLSRPHLESTIKGEQFLGMVVCQGSAGQQISDDELAENARLFIKVTGAFLALCEEYAIQRTPV